VRKREREKKKPAAIIWVQSGRYETDLNAVCFNICLIRTYFVSDLNININTKNNHHCYYKHTYIYKKKKKKKNPGINSTIIRTRNTFFIIIVYFNPIY
jgi:hypothetical protein